MRQGPMTKAEEVARAVREEAERGDVDAQAAMGVMYLIGRGVEQDLEEAVAWLRRAAEQDNPDAQHNLGVAYDTGFCGMLPSDAVEAMAWYRLAANQGHAGSQYNLGVAYAEGNGVPQHDVQAIKWWRKAAERGSARAQYNLGVSYSKGEGVARDDVQAVEWWYRAAQSPDIATKPQRGWLSSPEGSVVKRGLGDAGRGEQGNADAQYHLGRMYALGRGVPRDNGRAAEWLRRAAAQGHSDARSELAKRVWRRILLLVGAAIVAMVITITLMIVN